MIDPFPKIHIAILFLPCFSEAKMDSNLLGECCEAPAWFVSAVDSGAVCLATEGGGG